MKILVIPCWYPCGEDKILGVYHKEFCRALSKEKDIKVDMLYLNRERLKSPLKYLFMKKKEVIAEDGYNVYLSRMLDVRKISFDLSMKLYCKKIEKAYLEYIKTNGTPDIIHGQVSIPSGYAACLLGEKYNIPVVVTEHASYFLRFFKGDYAKYGNYVLNHAYFTTVSNYMSAEIKSLGYQSEVLPNLVDTTIFKKNRKPIKGLRLVSAVGLRPGKRIDDILAALKIIIDENAEIDAKLTIIGDGTLESEYKKICHDLNLDSYVDFVGRKTKTEIADIFNEHNILVIASSQETFGIPGIEALASGMPVVSSICGGPEEYIDNKCGILYEVGDKEALAKAILEVYKNIDKYDTKYLRSIASKYSDKSIAKKAIGIYKKLLK